MAGSVQAAYDVLTPPGGAAVGVLVHVPHGALAIPPTERSRLLVNDAELAQELLLMTDRYTPELVARSVELGGTVLVNRVSRLVVDPERFPDDADEPMAPVGMGAVYTRTHDGRPLRSADADERTRLLAAYFEPYARAATDLAAGLLERFGRCLVIDAHSFPARPLRYELSQDPDRPAICIGTDEFHTPEALVQAIERICRERGASTERNFPFAGTYVPLPFWRREPRVTSVMIEVRRDTYMDEATGARSAAFEETQALVGEILEVTIATWTALAPQ